jgi:protein-disulfide isomerase
MSQIAESRLTKPVSEQDHIKGPLTAPVEVVEYGDYECPHCGQAYRVMKKIQRQLGDKICFVFRNFPLTNVHPHAELAAEAAEAAGAQNKFWQMHDQIFEHQQALEFEDLVRYAKALGLDTSRFNQDLTESRYLKRVREDFSSGVRSGVNGTPTFFLNGKRHDGSSELSSLLAAIEDASTKPR